MYGWSKGLPSGVLFFAARGMITDSRRLEVCFLFFAMRHGSDEDGMCGGNTPGAFVSMGCA